MHLSFGSSKPGRNDKEGHPIITVVHRSGIHEIGISWCCCSGAPERDMQLMMAGLFPATFHNPKTAFTFWVLEDFHLDNLEGKTTPGQFFSRLRRLTNDEFSNTVPVTIRARTSRAAYSPVMTTVLRMCHLTLVMDSRLSQRSSITCTIMTHS